jgi:hypothetical protein
MRHPSPRSGKTALVGVLGLLAGGLEGFLNPFRVSVFWVRGDIQELTRKRRIWGYRGEGFSDGSANTVVLPGSVQNPGAVGLGLGESAKSECTGYWKHLGEIRSVRHPSPRSGKTALVGFVWGC